MAHLYRECRAVFWAQWERRRLRDVRCWFIRHGLLLDNKQRGPQPARSRLHTHPRGIVSKRRDARYRSGREKLTRAEDQEPGLRAAMKGDPPRLTWRNVSTHNLRDPLVARILREPNGNHDWRSSVFAICPAIPGADERR